MKKLPEASTTPVDWDCSEDPGSLNPIDPTVGALTIRIGFWGILYYNNKEPPKVI